MELRKFQNTENLKGLENYCIVNESKDTRHGFKHVSTLIFYDSAIATESCYYLNRTWECYRYQTSMKAVVNKYLQEIKDNIIYYYKQDNNIKRLTKKHKEAIEKLFNEDNRITELKEIYKQLENAR
jgi:hypothetical protein